MKRKANSSVYVLQHISRLVQDIQVTLSFPRKVKHAKTSRTPFTCTLIQGEETLSKGADAVDLVIDFGSNPLSHYQAERAQVTIRYVGDKEAKANEVILTVLPADTFEVTKLLPGQLEYKCFSTHVLQIHQNPETVSKIYVRLENNLIYSSSSVDIQFELGIDMNIAYMIPIFDRRYYGLPFFPPDLDPALYHIRVDPRTIPQRTPLWFKLRGPVTGSKAYKLMGYSVPTDKSWSYYQPESFNKFQKCRMRLGALSEHRHVMTYLLHHPTAQFYEVGLCEPPEKLHYPKGWGASPDGLIIDTAMSWDQVPVNIAKYYKQRDFNITHGAVEFKTSTSKLDMEAYYLPQVYMEMISLNVLWCDLVRYQKSSFRDPKTNQWKYEHKFRCYRIYRHQPTERLLMDCLKHALANVHQLQQIVQEKEFVALRNHFQKLCLKLDGKDLPVTEEIQACFEAYDAKQNAIRTHGLSPNPVEEDMDVWKSLLERAQLMHERYQMHDVHSKQELVRLVGMQIQEYGQLLQIISALQ